jgi:hypothetical protein
MIKVLHDTMEWRRWQRLITDALADTMNYITTLMLSNEKKYKQHSHDYKRRCFNFFGTLLKTTLSRNIKYFLGILNEKGNFTPKRTKSNSFSDALFRTYFFVRTFLDADRGAISAAPR